MNEHMRIFVPLSREEFAALRTSAERDYRHPREQARYLLRSVLLGEQRPTDDKAGAESAKMLAGNVTN